MADLSNYLKQQYASQLESELAGLKEAYESQRNFAAATNALEKQAFDERANAMGLNTGTSGQAQLARSSAYQRELADLGAAELVAMAKAKADNATAMNNALYAEMVRQDKLAAARAAGGGGGTVSSYAPTITVNKAAESAKGSGTTSFSNVQRTISAALQTGDFNKASNLAGGVWAQATTNQRNDLKTLFERNGYSIDN